MQQSKTGVDDMDYATYVTLEVQTSDSLYRIPLEFIDSISFVQPELRPSPQLHRIDAEGASDYLSSVSDDKMTLTFSSLLPEALRPAVGQVLMDCSSDDVEQWYGGKVVSVEYSDGNLVVKMEPITQLSDVFDQFVTVEQLIVPEDKNEPIRRRVAGMRQFNERRKAEGNWSLDPWTQNFDMNLTLDNIWKEVGGMVGLHIGFGVSGSFVYKLTSDDYYLNITIAPSFEFKINTALDLKLWGADDDDDNLLMQGGLLASIAKRVAIPFPAALPVGQVQITPLPFLRTEGHIVMNFSGGCESKKLKLNAIISKEKNDVTFFDPEAGAISPTWDLSLEANGFVHLGLSYPVKVRTNPALDAIVQGSLGGTLYAGPKASGNVTLDLKQLGSVGGIYQSLKNSSLSLTLNALDYKVEAEIKSIWGKKTKFSKEWSKNFLTWTWGLFPSFEKPECTIDPLKPRSVKASVGVEGAVLFNQTLGLGLYNEKGELVTAKFRDQDYSRTDAFNSLSAEFENLQNGRYQLLPVIGKHPLLPDNIPARPEKKSDEVWFDIEGYDISISPDRMQVGPALLTQQLPVETNCSHISVSSSAPSWLKGYYAESTGLNLTVERYDASKRDAPRSGTLTITGEGSDGKHSCTLDVVQLPVDPSSEYLYLTPATIECGGEGVNNRRIKMVTNYEMPEVYDSGHRVPSWIHVNYSPNRKDLLVTVDPNSEQTTREDYVVISGSRWWSDVTDTLRIKQQSLLGLAEDELDFTADGGKKDVKVELQDIGVRITLTPSADWLGATYANGQLTVTADRNYEPKAREATLTVSAEKNGVSVKGYLLVRQQSYITLTPDHLYVDAEGDIVDVKVESHIGKPDIQAVNRWIGVGLTDGGTRMTVAVDPNTTGQVREGYAAVQARSGKETILINLPVTQSGDDNLPEEDDELYVSMSGGEQEFADGGGNGYLSYSTNTTDVSVVSSGWIETTQQSDGRIRFKVKPNKSTSARTGSIRVIAHRDGEQKSATLRVRQLGKPKDDGNTDFEDRYVDKDFDRISFYLEVNSKGEEAMTEAFSVNGPETAKAYGFFTHSTHGASFTSQGENQYIYSYTEDFNGYKYRPYQTIYDESWDISLDLKYEAGKGLHGPIKVKYAQKTSTYHVVWEKTEDGYRPADYFESEPTSISEKEIEFELESVTWNGDNNDYTKDVTFFTSHMFDNEEAHANIKKVNILNRSYYREYIFDEDGNAVGSYLDLKHERLIEQLPNDIAFAMSVIRLYPVK